MNLKLREVVQLAVFSAMLAVLSGCTTAAPKQGDTETRKYDDSDEIQVGDMLKITFSGSVSSPIPDHEDRVSEQGFINLPQVGEVKAAGKGRVELQKEITKLYVPKIYRHLTVTIAPDQRFFYVNGEVNKKDRHFYAGELTVLGAISAAGGFTDFADKTEVQLIRGDGTVEIIDCKKALKNPSEFNIEVLPGDQINVPRRWY